MLGVLNFSKYRGYLCNVNEISRLGGGCSKLDRVYVFCLI